MSSAADDTPEEGGEEKKDALDEWVDELDRLIGIEPMSEEEIAEQNRAVEQKKQVDLLPYLVLAIIILAAVALLFYFHVL